MVVFVKDYAMDNDGRRKKSGLFRRMFWGSSWSVSSQNQRRSNASLSPLSPPRERRPLRSVPTGGPRYKVDPEVLLKDYVEKEIAYMGMITDLRSDFDAGNRTAILSLLDEKRRAGLLPWQLSYRDDIILSFSVYNVKVLKRDGEQLIYRIPTHQISSIGYVKDDAQVFLFFKFASEVNDEMCSLAIFCADNVELTEEICCLTQQLFQLVYTESTMDFFDKSIQDGANTPKNHSYSTDDSQGKRDTIVISPNTGSNLFSSDCFTAKDNLQRGDEINKHKVASSAPSSIHRRDNVHLSNSNNAPSNLSFSSTPSSPAPQRRSGSGPVSSSSSNHHIQLEEYINVLKERLTNDELTLFAQHLHSFRTGGIPIKVFCDQLMEVYTQKRKSLLLGMRHFIPGTRDRVFFETFLKQHNVELTDELDFEVNKRWWSLPPPSGGSGSRTVSETEESLSAIPSGHITEISSNSETGSNQDSGEWHSIVSRISNLRLEGEGFLSDDNTLVSGGAGDVTAGRAEVATEDEAKEIPNETFFEREMSNRHLLRSGEITNVNLIQQRESRHEKSKPKKKQRGKSPSAMELGAPYPSVATGGTDGDLDSGNKPPKTSKIKDKLQLSSSSSEKRKKKLKKLSQDSASISISNPNSPSEEFPSSAIGGAQRKHRTLPSTLEEEEEVPVEMKSSSLQHHHRRSLNSRKKKKRESGDLTEV